MKSIKANLLLICLVLSICLPLFNSRSSRSRSKLRRSHTMVKGIKNEGDDTKDCQGNPITEVTKTSAAAPGGKCEGRKPSRKYMPKNNDEKTDKKEVRRRRR